MLQFHGREIVRHDWRAAQIALIDEGIYKTIKALGINDRSEANPKQKEVAEDRQGSGISGERMLLR
jgi:hypothetical protein